MEKRLFLVIMVLLSSAILFGCVTKEQTQEPVISDLKESYILIEIKNFKYIPEEVIIHVGETVTWINSDSIKHTVTSESGNELDSGMISRGQNYTHTFNSAGVYEYYCVPHPYMQAKVIVE